MGEAPETTFLTGCPSIDLTLDIAKETMLPFDPYVKYGGVGSQPSLANGYLVVMQHPVTTEHGQARQHVWETLCAVLDLGLPTLWFWPNVDAGADETAGGIRAFRELERPLNLHFFKNMTSTDFLHLIHKSSCLIGNSSVGIRESAFLGIPVVNIGSRQQGRERGRNVVDVGHEREAIKQAIQRQMENGRYPPQPIYGNGNAGERIADLLATVPLTIEKRLTY